VKLTWICSVVQTYVHLAYRNSLCNCNCKTRRATAAPEVLLRHAIHRVDDHAHNVGAADSTKGPVH
jgi:hypothetical protein